MMSQTAPDVSRRKGERQKRRDESVSGKLTEETGSELQTDLHMISASSVVIMTERSLSKRMLKWKTDSEY